MTLTSKENINDLLIIIDMVNGFAKEGPLADTYISRLIPMQKKLIEFYKNNKNKGIAFVKEAHHENSREFQTFPPHCIINTEEAELVEELKEYEPKALIYPKNSTSAMFAPNFISDLETMKNLRRMVITGCCTDICIINTAIPLINYLNQNDRNIEVIVPKELSETYNIPDVHERQKYNEIALTLMNQAGISTEMPKDLVKVLTK